MTQLTITAAAAFDDTFAQAVAGVTSLTTNQSLEITAVYADLESYLQVALAAANAVLNVREPFLGVQTTENATAIQKILDGDPLVPPRYPPA